MLTLFDDDSFPRMRRSLFLTSLTITLVAYFGLSIKLPSFLDASNLDNDTIPQGATLIFLWVAQGYLYFRYITNLDITKKRFDLNLRRDSTVKSIAEHYSAQLNEIDKTLRNFSENRSEAVTTIRQQLDKIEGLSDEVERISILCSRVDDLNEDIRAIYSKDREDPRRTEIGYDLHMSQSDSDLMGPSQDRSYCRVWCLRVLGHAAI